MKTEVWKERLDWHARMMLLMRCDTVRGGYEGGVDNASKILGVGLGERKAV
jgi:hypothetical protein